MAPPNFARYRRTPGISPAGAPRMGLAPNVIQADMPEPADGLPVPPGALVQYYSDLASGAIAPEDMRIEDLQYRVQINPAGNITFESDKVSLISRYSFAIRRIVGFSAQPDFDGIAPYLLGVQVREEGRNFEIFKRPINMGALLRDAEGIASWDGVYITVPGTDLATLWTPDTQRWAALVGATREYGIQISGDYVACAPER